MPFVPFPLPVRAALTKFLTPRREEVVQQRQWAFIRYEQVKRQGLGPETVKMQALIQRCDTELEEMNLMEEYQKDEAYTPNSPSNHKTDEPKKPPPWLLKHYEEKRHEQYARQGHRRSTRQKEKT